jgi:hypothetical protein
VQYSTGTGQGTPLSEFEPVAFITSTVIGEVNIGTQVALLVDNHHVPPFSSMTTMRAHPYLSFRMAALLMLLMVLGLARAETGFEGGHWRRSTPNGPSTFVIPLALDKSGFYHSVVRMVSISFRRLL